MRRGWQNRKELPEVYPPCTQITGDLKEVHTESIRALTDKNKLLVGATSSTLPGVVSVKLNRVLL